MTRFYQVDNITGYPHCNFWDLAPYRTVEPDYATNQTIVWSVKDPGTTVATITGNTLSTRAVGTVIVTATIANGSKVINDVDGSYSLADYTQDFEIEVRELVLNPAPPLTTVTAEPGTIANSTRLTNLYYDGAVSYAVCILGDFYAHPNVGDSIPAGVPAYNLGDNIMVTAGTPGIYAPTATVGHRSSDHAGSIRGMHWLRRKNKIRGRGYEKVLLYSYSIAGCLP